MKSKRNQQIIPSVRPKQKPDLEYLVQVANQARITFPEDQPSLASIRRSLANDHASRYYQRIFDSLEPAGGSRIDTYWSRETLILIADRFYGNRKIPKSFQPYNPDFVAKHFDLRGLEFGNWTSQEDRLNYLVAAAISLADMAKIIGFTPSQIGFKGKLTLGIGSRGRGGKALAFFQPGYFAINLTRYRKEAKKGDHYQAMLNTGGAGSLSHEWAHALDYFLGRNDSSDPFNYITGNDDRTRLHPLSQIPDSFTPLKKEAEQLFRVLLWDDKKGELNTWGKDLSRIRDLYADYWARRVEIFARFFESWLAWQLSKRRIKNTFLTKEKYQLSFKDIDPKTKKPTNKGLAIYPPPALIKKADPHIRNILKMAKKMI